MKLHAGCKTTAMGIMPHTDIDRAIGLSLSLDIPFWPQLPNVSFYEDMYAQCSQNFPGISVDTENKRVVFNTARFEDELVSYSQKLGDIENFTLSGDYSAVYHRFLAKELNHYPAIRGQLTGPVSFGFKIVDENGKPIMYNEEVKSLLFDFIQKKVNVQYQELRHRNENAFVWVDEPGLGWVFSSLSGYNDIQALKDYRDFIKGLEGPRALHLCANVNLPFLLELGVSVLSFDAYQLGVMPREYARAVGVFIRNGGIMCWGIVPTDSTNLRRETPQSLGILLSDYWQAVSQTSGVAINQVAAQSLLAPARCCLKNIGQVGAANESACVITERCPVSTIEESLVEKAFAYLREMSQILRDKYDVK